MACANAAACTVWIMHPYRRRICALHTTASKYHTRALPVPLSMRHLLKEYYKPGQGTGNIINPRRACEARVTVLGLSLCLCYTFSATMCNEVAKKR